MAVDTDISVDAPVPGNAPVIDLRGVGRTFPGPPPVEAFKPSHLRIGQGEYVSIIGPSGSGKSTLLHLLGLLDRPTVGNYFLDGIDTGALGDNARAGLRGSRIGFVFQSFHLLHHRSVLENVELAQIYNRMPRKERRARAEAALERVGLSHRLKFTPRTLSGGERQRVAVARALVTEPSLLLADEPTGNLDTEMSAEIMEVFDDLHAGGLTLAVITHDLDVSERAERQVRIVDGTLHEA
jgi:putative ABC transport system ATP-binding protein